LVNYELDEPPAGYVSEPQRARIVTEAWVKRSVFCPNCGALNIQKYPNNRPVADFYCADCKEDYELKSQKNKFGPKVLDGAFGSMCARLAANDNPNLMLMNYDSAKRTVTTLFVVPKQFFVREIIEERPPLARTARRAGWIGCNILLNGIPELGKIYYRRDGQDVPRDLVLEKWQQSLFLRGEGLETRGWLIEVMKCVEKVGKADFDLSDVYAFEARLSAIFPNNRHVKQKIRQQLQYLRDRGFLEFIGRGHYRVKAFR
jgi:type II restriction enzyme